MDPRLCLIDGHELSFRAFFGVDSQPIDERAFLGQVAQRFPDIEVAGDVSTIFEDPSVDAVIIATPTVTHYELVRAALEAGKHVLVEKPITTSSAEAQEHVTLLLLTLARDADNCIAIAKAGAIPRLVVQLKGGGRTSVKAQELAAAVLSHLTKTEESIKAIATSNGIRPLVQMLTTGTVAAQAHAAAVLSDMGRASSKNQSQIISEGGIGPLLMSSRSGATRLSELLATTG